MGIGRELSNIKEKRRNKIKGKVPNIIKTYY